MLAATAETPAPNRLNAMSRLLFLLVAIVGGIAFYYFVLIERGTEHVSRRNFRTLAQIETQITGGFERILSVASVAKIDEVSPTLEVASHRYKIEETSNHCAVPNKQPFGRPKPGPQQMCFRITSGGDNTSLDLSIRIDKAEERASDKDRESGEPSYITIKNVPLAHFLDFSNGQEQFQQILIFGANRRLALRSSSDTDFSDNLDSYDQISSSQTTHESLVELPKSWNKREETRASNKKAEDDTDEEQALLVTKVQKFTIGNEKYLAFIRPFTLPYPEAGQTDRPEVWYAVGITTEAEFNASRFMLPQWWVAIMVLGLLMAAFTLPYIKLKLLGPRDLITTWTITWAVLGLTASMIIGVTMLLNLSSHHLSEQKMVTSLKGIGTNIARQLDREYAQRGAELAQVIERFPDVGQSELPAFDRISIFDEKGYIYATSSYKNTNFKRFSATDRHYWQEMQHNRALNQDGSDLTFSQETIESRLDGERNTVLAMRRNSPLPASSSLSNACRGKWTYFGCYSPPTDGKYFSIVAGSYRYEILDKIILPKGFGFIVIDNSSGIVQYHSEERANMVERLYEETDNNTELKAAINAHHQRTFGTNYRGQLFFFNTQPLAYSEWTLITYFNRELLDRVNLGLLLTATGLSLAYFIIVVTLMILGFRSLSQTRINHLWPYQGQGRAYVYLVVLLASLAAIEAVAVYALHAEELLIVLLACPVLALSGAYMCLIRHYSPFAQSLLFRIPRRLRWHWRRYLIQAAMAGSIFALVYSFAATLKQTPLADAVILPPIVVAMVALLFAATALGRRLAAYLIGILRLDHASDATTDRRSDRNMAFILHRWCLVFLVVIGALLPTLAFFRDTTALHVVRWLQEDARKMRYQLERMASNPNSADYSPTYRADVDTLDRDGNKKVRADLAAFFDDAASDMDQLLDKELLENRHLFQQMIGKAPPVDKMRPYEQRVEALIQYNTDYTSLTPQIHGPCNGDTREDRIYAPTFVRAGEQQKLRNTVPAIHTIMWPVVEIASANALPLHLFKLALSSGSSSSEDEWRRCAQLHKKELISVLPLQHGDVVGTSNPSTPSLQLLQRWHFSEIGMLRWWWLWAAVLGVIALVIGPMVRLVLREITPDSNLRPHPNLSLSELQLLCDDWHGVVLLVSPSPLRRNTQPRMHWSLEALEADVVKLLTEALPDTCTVSRLEDAMRQPGKKIPDVLVVAEYHWPARFAESVSHSIKLPQLTKEVPWKKFLIALNKLRLPDDFPGLALNHWLPPRNFTLLVCHSTEAQLSLRDFVANRPTPPGERWQLLQPGAPISTHKRIWISHLEKILHMPTERRRLLDFLESARQQPDGPAIVLTGLILPHQWIIDPPAGMMQPPDARERARWLSLLASMDVRSVEALNYEHELGERTRARHALPRAGREAEYELWWEYSTPAERIAMAALAHEGLINPLNHVVIRSLLARGIIFRQRKLRFSDHSFREFVRYRLPATELHRHADLALQGSSWGAARGPLLVTLAVLGYGVMAMGGGTVETTLALVTSIGASIPALLNLTRLLRSGGSA